MIIVLALGGVWASLAMNKAEDALVVYSGRSEELIGPLIEQFRAQSGLAIQVRYGGTAELAATILEEGRHSPADVFFAQDAGALGALRNHGRLAKLPADILDQVPPAYRSPDGVWVGISGRARVVVFNTERLTETDLPADLFGFCDPAWKGRLGWAPENGSFQSFVTALRMREGDARATEWLRGIKANAPRTFAKNSAIVAAVAAGEIDVGFVNHYYLYTARKTQPDIKAANYYFPGESAGSLVNVAGMGILDSSKKSSTALALIRFLLSPEAQSYFVRETSEYPVIADEHLGQDLRPLQRPPELRMDLNLLDDLEGTLRIMQEAGVL
jgi:iron(III) transport system substrate-binding protein